MENPILLSPEQCAEMLGIGRSFVYQLIATGRLKSLKLNRRRLVPRAALDAFVARELAGQSDATSVQPNLPPATSGEEKVQ